MHDRHEPLTREYALLLVLHLDDVRADGRPWRVEFIIADTPRHDGRFNIPFFSKVSLRDEIRTMRAVRYETALKFIGLQHEH